MCFRRQLNLPAISPTDNLLIPTLLPSQPLRIAFAVLTALLVYSWATTVASSRSVTYIYSSPPRLYSEDNPPPETESVTFGFGATSLSVVLDRKTWTPRVVPILDGLSVLELS